MLDTRKETLLRFIIEDYIQSAEPVGSKQLAQRHRLDVSSATIRNEMAWLEQEGYLRHPHTSAGRVPTEKAYLYYLQHVVEQAPTPTTKEFCASVSSNDSLEFTLRCVAKRLVDMTGETAIVAIDPRFGYYTGVSNLFTKPDFEDEDVMRAVSVLVDQFDDVVSKIYHLVGDQTVVYVGSQNPFGHQMATIMAKYRLGNHHEGLLGLVGPLRMDYGRNITLVEQAKELIMDMYE